MALLRVLVLHSLPNTMVVMRTVTLFDLKCNPLAREVVKTVTSATWPLDRCRTRSFFAKQKKNFLNSSFKKIRTRTPIGACFYLFLSFCKTNPAFMDSRRDLIGNYIGYLLLSMQCRCSW